MSEKCGCEGEWNTTTGAGDVDHDGCAFPEALRLINALILAQEFRSELGDEAQEFVEKHK